MRIEPIIVGEYYHIYNRGNDKRPIFLDNHDWARFLFLILYFQSPVIFENLNRVTTRFIKTGKFPIDHRTQEDIIAKKTVEVVNFCFMENHFHLTLREIHEHGITNYMQRVLTAYTKYFNIRYKKNGHLFQGPYQYVHIKDNDQLLYLSTYIHRNPRSYKKWVNKEDEYFYSSLQDYTKRNRWGGLIEPSIILNQFQDNPTYKEFVASSTAKINEYDDNIFLDSGL